MRKNLKVEVETILQNIPETRNCDIRLTIEIWKAFYPSKILKRETVPEGSKLAIDLDSLFVLPREDNVKRWRAIFQNDLGKYLPTIWEVARKRKINVERWREALGYPPKGLFDK